MLRRALATAARAGRRTPRRHRLSEIPAGTLPPLLFERPDAPDVGAGAPAFAAPPLSRGLAAMLASMLGPGARPTTPQAHALAHMFRGGWGARPAPAATLIAAETGSGKTLAYLLPLLQKLHDTRAATEHADRAHVERGGEPRVMPRAIVLAPTHELARQIAGVAKMLCHHPEHKLRVACTSTPGYAESLARDCERVRDVVSGGAPASPDVLVATPGRLHEQCVELGSGERPLSLANVQTLVVDEADTLLDRGFGAATHAVLAALAPRSVRVDVVFVSATIPATLSEYLGTHYPRLTKLASPQLHRLPARLQTAFVDPGRNMHVGVLRELLRVFTTPGCERDQVLIFRDRRGQAQQLAHFLRQRNVDVVELTGDAERRSARTSAQLAHFLVDPRRRAADAPPATTAAPRVLVTTSLLSRGLDFGPDVRHVFLPDAGRDGRRSVHAANNNALELLHRAGRSARAGRAGRVVLFDTASAPGHAKVLLNRSGQKRGVVRGQMALLVRELRGGSGRSSSGRTRK